MSLLRRVPKRGFTNIFRTEYAVVNVGDLGDLEGTVGLQQLVETGKVRKGALVKILGEGLLERALVVQAHKFSRSAREKIEGAGGKCEEIVQ